MILVGQELLNQGDLLIMQVDSQAAQRSDDANDDGQGDAIQLRHGRRVLRPFFQPGYSLI